MRLSPINIQIMMKEGLKMKEYSVKGYFYDDAITLDFARQSCTG